MWRVARAQVRAAAGDAAEAERLAREAVELAAPTDFLDLQATALVGLARVLREAGSAEAASVAGQAQAVYERKGNVVGAKQAGWLAAHLAAEASDSPFPASRPDDRVAPDLRLGRLTDLEAALD